MSDVERVRYARACGLLERLESLPPEERGAMIDRETGDDPETASLVRSMLAHLVPREAVEIDPARHDEARGNAADGASAEPGAHEGLRPGDVIGRWTLVSHVADGASSSVWCARDEAGLAEQSAALKILHRETGAGAIARLSSEAHVLLALDHPGVVRLIESDHDPTCGRSWIAMEIVDGSPLDRRDPSLAGSVRACVELAAEVAEAVQAAHELGVIHRDLKPDNILMTAPRGNDRETVARHPKVIDFGVARALAESSLSDAFLESIASYVGTPAYMSPEQTVAGGAVTVRTDVHALGVVLFELLCGRRPFDDDGVGADAETTLRRIAHEMAPIPSEAVRGAGLGLDEAAARRRAREIDGDLDAIVRRALEKDPRDRYPSMRGFARDLRRWLDGEPVEARPVGALRRAARFARRRPIESAAIVAIPAALIVGLAIALAGLRASWRAQERLAEQVATTDAIDRFVTDEVFARAAPELDGPQAPIIEIVRASADRADTVLRDVPAVETGIRATLGSVLARLHDFDAAERQLELGAKVAASLPIDHPQRIRFEVERGSVLVERERFDEGIAALRPIVPVAERVFGADHRFVIDAWNDLGVAYSSLDRTAEARAALETARDRSDGDVRRRFTAVSNLLVAEQMDDEQGTAVERFEELIALSDELFGPEHVYGMALRINLANTLLDLGRPGEALPHAERGAAIAEVVFEPPHRNLLTAWNNLASCQSILGRADEAIATRERVLAGAIELDGEESAFAGRMANNLASALVRAGLGGEAMPHAMHGARVVLPVVGTEGRTFTSVLTTLVKSAEAAGATPSEESIDDDPRSEAAHLLVALAGRLERTAGHAPDRVRAMREAARDLDPSVPIDAR